MTQYPDYLLEEVYTGLTSGAHTQTHFHTLNDSFNCGEDGVHLAVTVWRIGLTKL